MPAGLQRVFKTVQIHRPGSSRHALVEQAGERGRAPFRRVHVGCGFQHHLLAALGLRQDGQQVGHGAAGHEQAGLFAQEIGHRGFQFAYGGIAIQAVIADRGGAHPLVHGCGGMGDRIAAQVDGRADRVGEVSLGHDFQC